MTLFRTNFSDVIARWPLGLIFVVWFCLFWQMNSGQTVIGFRDSAYLYYPYFKWIDQQWAAGEFPLWNPYCDLGHPVVGDGTSSLFYPVKLVFFVRALSFPARYGIYLSSHVLLAALGAWWLIRRLGGSRFGAGLGAFSYAFGGSVLFQTTNVVFLISAAWLPFALGCVWMMLKRASIKPAIGAGLAAAMMILGGDPQMAYLTGLIAVACWLGKWLRFCRRHNYRSESSRLALSSQLSRFRSLLIGGRQLTLFACVAASVAAIQILPTYEWSKNSNRQTASPLRTGQLFQPLKPGTSREATYQFSQPPWTLCELFAPNLFGKPYPVHRRWTKGLPGDERIWTPSLYVGLVTIVMALTSIRLWGRQRKRVWLTRLVLFFATASFGWYGAVWLFNELAIAMGREALPDVGRPVGGLYWAMTLLVPKFYLFRYPAKLFVVASLAICVLAGLNCNWRDVGRSFQKASVCIPHKLPSAVLAASLLGIVLVWSVDLLPSNIAPDTLFGPFDNVAALSDLQNCLMHASVVALVLIAVSGLDRASWFENKSALRVVCLLLAMAELALANHWLLPQVTSDQFERTTATESSVIELRSESNLKSYPIPFVRESGTPEKWVQESSYDRLEEVLDWQRATLHPKHNLLSGCHLFGSFASIENQHNREFANQFLEKENLGAEVGELVSLPLDSPSHAGFYLKTVDQFPLDQFRFLDSDTDVESIDTLWRTIWYPSSAMDRGNQILGKQFPLSVEHFSNHRCVVRCEPTERTLLAFRTIPVSGWRVIVRGLQSGKELTSAQLDASNYFLLVELPAGPVEIEYVYWPVGLRIGACISITSSLLLICFLWIGRRRTHK